MRDRSFCDVLEDQEFARLAAIVAGRSYNAREAIIREGDDAEWLFNIISGKVKIYRSMSDGRIQIFGFLSEGDFMGIPTTSHYRFSAEALTPIEVCVFPRQSFDRLRTECPNLERRLFEIARNEVAAARDHMVLLGRKTAREKVATFLVEQATRRKCDHELSPAISLPMTRVEIADYVGLTMETVSRTLGSLRDEGLIILQSADRILLERLPELARIAAGDA